MNSKSHQLWLVNLFSFILFSILAITGLTNWIFLPRRPRPDGGFLNSLRHFFRDVHKTKPKFRKSGGRLYQTIIDKDTGEEVIVNNLIREIRTPIDENAIIDFGVPITTLTEMIDRDEL